MATVEEVGHFINEMWLSGVSYAEISERLIAEFGEQRGFSERSIRRYCSEHNLLRRPLTNDRLEVEVARAIHEVGPTFGRKMLTGYLANKGVRAGEKRVASVLRDMHQPYHEERCNGARNLNPTPYMAEYMGHKIHLDQNEKLVMFGATHVLAMDGYSSKIVGYATMPVKNNLRIYGDVYRSAVLNYGLWDQVRVDHGREFYLTLFMQENFQAYRNNQDRHPYTQTKSTENHRIERIWVEVNNRVNYPLKAALVDLQDKELVNMEDNAVKFCTSELLCQVSSIGIERVVGAWNAHSIPGRGVPNHLAGNGCKVRVSEELLPSPPEAAAWYDRELNSSLARDSCFGEDPFRTPEAKMRAEAEFGAVFSNLSVMYEGAVHNYFKPFQDALLYLIDSARRHS